MPRLIDADALREVWLASDDLDNDAINAVLYSIDAAPTVDAEPVRHAKVVTVTGRYHMMHQECSYCGGELGWKEYPIYCPNCGAKMDEVE